MRRGGRFHGIHFPNESDEYRAARDALPTDPGDPPAHVDFIWPLWAVLDLTLEGRGTDLGPELAYR